MTGMKRGHVVGIVLVTAGAVSQLCPANEQSMRQALDMWKQQEAEYQAALSVATTPEQRKSLPPPSTGEVAAALWKAIRTRTGTREVPLQPGERRGKSAGKGARKVATYEFDEEWAAPAVVWFLNRPEVLAKLFEDSPQKLPVYAQALLDSVKNKHYSSPLIADACAVLAGNSSKDVYDVLQKIYTHNTYPAARAGAALAMSVMLANRNLVDEEGGPARARAKRLSLIRQALQLAPPEQRFGPVSLTDAAQELIYRMKVLDIGAIPPQLKVSDTQGTEQLFPVAGKANLLFFWDPGEDVGLSIMQKQASLKKQYPQLVLCPIVVHGEREEWLKVLHDNGVQTCYMDDEQGTTGRAYRVSQLPHAVLVDEHARILYSGYPDMQLQTALNEWQQHGSRNSPPSEQSPTPAPSDAQQEPQPSPPDNTAPPLREMPQF